MLPKTMFAVIISLFLSTFAWGQAQIPPSRPMQVPDSNAALAKLDESCRSNSLNAEIEITTQVLHMILDEKSFDSLVNGEEKDDPEKRLQSRLKIIRAYIDGLKANASR